MLGCHERYSKMKETQRRGATKQKGERYCNKRGGGRRKKQRLWQINRMPCAALLLMSVAIWLFLLVFIYFGQMLTFIEGIPLMNEDHGEIFNRTQIFPCIYFCLFLACASCASWSPSGYLDSSWVSHLILLHRVLQVEDQIAEPHLVNAQVELQIG